MWLMTLRLRSCCAAGLARDSLLQVSVQPLVWVQLRTVGGQVEYLDLGPVRGQPVADLAGPVHLQPVQN